MSGNSQPTMGNWEYQSHRSRQIVSDTGETVAKVHRGKKAQHNGPILSAALDNAVANALLIDAVKRMRVNDAVPDLDERIRQAEEAIAKAKGNQATSKART